MVSRGLMLVETVTAKDETRAAQTESAKQFRELLTGLDQRQRDLSRVIRTRIEQRMIRCVVHFHTPAEATKRVIRIDTGEVVKEVAMSAEECQMHMFSSQVEFEAFMRAQEVGKAPPDEKKIEPPG